MLSITRFTRGRALAVALLAALLVGVVGTAVAGSVHPARTSVPAALVGRWGGGAHSNGPWYYEFSAGGTYRAWPARDPDRVNSGTVAVDDTTLAFSNGGAAVTSTWSLTGGVLTLDGERYVRG